MKIMTSEKQKAANLLFEELESEIQDKEKFVLEQSDRLKQLNTSFQTLNDYKKVLQKVQETLPAIQQGRARQSMGGGLHTDNENRGRPVSHNIQ